MATELAVLLRNCPHNAVNAAAGNIGYALKVTQISVQVAKTPIQIPIPQSSPELVDIGSFRPSINIVGLVDNIGGDSTNINTANVYGMSAVQHLRTAGPDGDASAKTYYVPYKNRLEDAVYNWVASGTDNLELEVGDAMTAVGFNHTHNSSAHTHLSTGGGVYFVAIQQCRFQLDAAKEDRWEFNMQFVCKSRDGVTFTI